MNVVDWVLLIVVLVLEESVVALSIPSGHLYLPDSCSVGHFANHS